MTSAWGDGAAVEFDAAADERDLRTTFGCFPTGVTAVCALGVDGPDGMTASAFTPVSLKPPLVSVCVQRTSRTWPRLRARPRLGVSVLSASQGPVGLSLSRSEGDRFDGVPWVAHADGAVVICGAVAWLDCALDNEIVVGDHLVVVLRILGLRSDVTGSPLVFHGSRFRSLFDAERPVTGR